MSSGEEKADDNYELTEEIGSGSFGIVYKANERTNSNELYAIKKVDHTVDTALAHLKMLRSLKHKYITSIVHAYRESSEKVCLVMEYANVGTLTEWIQNSSGANSPRLQEHNIWRMIAHMSSALNYLHKLKPKFLLHGGIKPNNIMGFTAWSASENKNSILWKLADFGISKMVDEDIQKNYFTRVEAGVPIYMAPEVLLDFKRYSFASDVWSLACLIVFRCSRGKHLFGTAQKVRRWKAGKDPFPAHYYSMGLLVLVKAMLSPEPDQRPTAKYVYAEAHKSNRQEIGQH